VRGHYFPGGHTWMAAMRDDPAQLARIREMLVGAASIDVAAAYVTCAATPGDGDRCAAAARGPFLPADGAPVTPGSRLELDVVLRNLMVGHRFPGGVNDVQDTWIEVEIHDARGRRVVRHALPFRRGGWQLPLWLENGEYLATPILGSERLPAVPFRVERDAAPVYPQRIALTR